MELEELMALTRLTRAREDWTPAEKERIFSKARDLLNESEGADPHVLARTHPILGNWRHLTAIAGSVAATVAVVVALLVAAPPSHHVLAPSAKKHERSGTVTQPFTCKNTTPDSPVVAYVNYQLGGLTSTSYVGAVSLPSGRIRWRRAIPHDAAVESIAVAPNGETVYAVAGFSKGGMELLPIAAASGRLGRPIALPKLGPSQGGFAIAPDGREALIAQSGDIAIGEGPIGDTVTLVNLVTGTVQDVITVGKAPSGVAFSANSETAYVTTGTGLHVIDVSTARVTHVISVSQEGPIVVSRLGTVAVISSQGMDLVIPPATLSVVNLRTLRVEPPIHLPHTVGGYAAPLAVSCNGSVAFALVDYLGEFGTGLVRIDLATDEVRTVHLPSTNADIIAATPNDESVWAVSSLATNCPGVCQAERFIPLNPEGENSGTPVPDPLPTEFVALGPWVPAQPVGSG